MKIETQYLENQQAKLTVQVEPQPFEEAKHRAARRIAQKTKIPGFRPGKAPYNVILRTLGEGAIIEEALEILLDEIYPKVIEEAGIKPYGPGKLENMPSMDPPTFEFIVPLEAEVTLGDYHAIRFPYELPVIPEDNVERVLENFRNSQAVTEAVDRPGQEGDQVYIRLSGERKQVNEGENPSLIKDRPLPVIIDPENAAPADEWPYPGFSRQLLGLSASDEKTVSYQYPQDSQWESLRGVDAEFHILVESVKSRQVPELNDEFAKSIGQYESLGALISEIRASLERQAKEEFDATYNNLIIEEMLKDASIKFPSKMLDNEVEVFIYRLSNRLSQQGLDMDTYLKTRQMDMEALRKEVLPAAEKRLKQSLILFEVAEAEKIQITEEEIESESTKALGEISQTLSPTQMKKTVTGDFIRNMVGNISADMLIRHTYDLLQTIAKGEYQPKPETEQAAPQPGEEPMPRSADTEAPVPEITDQDDKETLSFNNPKE